MPCGFDDGQITRGVVDLFLQLDQGVRVAKHGVIRERAFAYAFIIDQLGAGN